MEEQTATPIEQATNELARHYKKTITERGEVEYLSLAEVIAFLASCGIDIGEDRYEFLLHLRSLGYQESKLDGEIKFHFYR